MNKKILIIIIAILILFIGFLAYTNDYYHAQDNALSYLNGSENVSVVKTDNGLLIDGPGNESALIFYPGAKVEYTSYLPLLSQLSQQGIDCYLVEMPLNLAILGSDSADEIIAKSNYTNYYMSGHSLGGAMAAEYTHKHENKIDGLILLGAYTTEEIDTTPVLSIYGSNDKILNMDKYNESKSLIKSNFTEFIINGANHAQFGDYSNQSGDGTANITAINQQTQTVNEILNFCILIQGFQ